MIPTKGVITNCPTAVPTLGSSAITSTASRRRPISSSASRSAASRGVASTTGSIFPPGNAICPWCDGMVSGRLVSTMPGLATIGGLPVAPNSGSRTAAAMLSGRGGGSGSGCGSAAQRALTSASVSVRRAAGSPAQGAGLPNWNSAGRGMT